MALDYSRWLRRQESILNLPAGRQVLRVCQFRRSGEQLG